jgi:hypothetical protein
MHMIERLQKAIELNEEADNLAMRCAGVADVRRLDQLVCDADNASRDFVRRHGCDVIAEIELLLATLADVVDHDFAYIGGEACVGDPRSLYNRVKRGREGVKRGREVFGRHAQ